MSALFDILKRAEKFTVDNSPLILTTIGVVGTLSTAVLATKATVQATRIIDRATENPVDRDEPLPITKREVVKHVWPLYVPSAGTAVLTVTCIIGSQRIGARRAAALAAAYTVSSEAFEEYRTKMRERLGAKKERELHAEIAQDRVNATPVSGNQVFVGSGEQLCFDLYSKRYFKSDVESIKKAQNDLNFTINNHMYASLNDFYDKIGLPHIKYGEEVGWTSYDLLDLIIDTTLSDDQRPCITIDFRVEPVRDYFRTH